MRIVAHELHRYRLPYLRPVRWFNSVEDEGEFVLLRITGESGALGVAEAPVKATWGGLSSRALISLVEDLLLPSLAAVDVSDLGAVREALAVYPDNQLAKMLVVNACAVLAAASRGEWPWQPAGSGVTSVEVSWCVTRQPPAAMAEEAAAMTARHGFSTLKLKGGQGFETDRAVLRAVRRAVGDEVTLTVDANGAYGVDDVRDYLRLLADEGVVIAEDPMPFRPDETFSRLVADSALPILVDTPCVTARDAAAFIDRGATAISIKPGRIGFAEAIAIAEMAQAANVEVCVGMYAESALGSLISLHFATRLARTLTPAEQSFYMMMTDQVLAVPLTITGGRIGLPGTLDLDTLVDWTKITSRGCLIGA